MKKIMASIVLMMVTVVLAEPKFDDLVVKAKAGDAEAMCGVAHCYCYGIGVARDPGKRAEWTQKAASNGCIRAVGICHEYGWGTPENRMEAVSCYRKAVENGDMLALACLGRCYESGFGVKRDAGEAVRLYCRGAEAGDARAMCSLAGCYKEGKGVPRDETECSKWHRKAADAGDALGMFFLGLNYARGCGVELSAQEHERWVRKSAEEGFSFAMFHLGEEYEHGAFPCENEDEVFKWYLKAGELGIISAMNCIGVCYYRGIGVERDVAKALKWFRKACEHGDAQARKNLTWLSSHEEGLTELESVPNLCGLMNFMCENLESRMFTELHDLDLGWRYRPARWCAKTVRRMLNGKDLKDVPRCRYVVAAVACSAYKILVQCKVFRVVVVFIIGITCFAFGYQSFRKSLRRRKNLNPMAYRVIYRESADPSLKSAVMTSTSEDRIRTLCEGNGWDILKIRCIGEAWWAAAFSRVLVRELRSPFRLGVSTREICSFCAVMHDLLAAGVLLPDAVAFCAKEERNRWFGKRLAVVLERLRDGDGLANAMEDPRCARAFPPLMRRAVRTGEANGSLGVSFGRLAVALELEDEKCGMRTSACGFVGSAIFFAVFLGILRMNKSMFCSSPAFLGFVCLACLAGCGSAWIFGLWIRRQARSSIPVKIAVTKISRKARRFSSWLDEKMTTGDEPLGLLLVALIALPFGLEQIGEATGLFHFPATAWVKEMLR